MLRVCVRRKGRLKYGLYKSIYRRRNYLCICTGFDGKDKNASGQNHGTAGMSGGCAPS